MKKFSDTTLHSLNLPQLSIPIYLENMTPYFSKAPLSPSLIIFPVEEKKDGSYSNRIFMGLLIVFFIFLALFLLMEKSIHFWQDQRKFLEQKLFWRKRLISAKDRADFESIFGKQEEWLLLTPFVFYLQYPEKTVDLSEGEKNSLYNLQQFIDYYEGIQYQKDWKESDLSFLQKKAQDLQQELLNNGF